MDRRTIVITGGGRGIGAAITREFHGHGDRVVIGSRVDTGLARELGDRVIFQPADVRDSEESRSLIDRAMKWSGQVDVLINNAGFSGWRSLAEIDEGFWNDMIDTNLKGTLFACQAAVPHMAEGSSIVNVSSLAGKRGSANNFRLLWLKVWRKRHYTIAGKRGWETRGKSKRSMPCLCPNRRSGCCFVGAPISHGRSGNR